MVYKRMNKHKQWPPIDNRNGDCRQDKPFNYVVQMTLTNRLNWTEWNGTKRGSGVYSTFLFFVFFGLLSLMEVNVVGFDAFRCR